MTPPRLTRQQYEDHLDGKQVITSGNPFFSSSHLAAGLTTRFFFLFELDSPLAIALQTPCSVFSTTTPAVFTSVTDITSLSLARSNLFAPPESLGGRQVPFFLGHLPSSPLFLFPVQLRSLVSWSLISRTISLVIPPSFLASIIKSRRTLTTLR